MKRQILLNHLSALFVGGLTMAFAVLALATTSLGQGTITFNRAAGLASTYYQEGGMWFQVVVPTGTTRVDVMGITYGADNTPRNGTPFLRWFRQYNPYDYVSLHLTNGATFGLTSVQLADPNNPSLGGLGITFVGHLSTGLTVNDTFTMPGAGPSTFATYTFSPAFISGLTRVDMLAPRWAMDNLVWIPEPAAGSLLALGLLALGLLALALARRKRRR